MNQWIDLSFIEHILHLTDPDILQLFGLNPAYTQFTLVFVLVMTVMWVVRPILEWLMIHHWATLSSYVTSGLLTLVFLQAVDRYAMVQNQSTLPESYWPICLLAISGFGFSYSVVLFFRNMKRKLLKKSKKRAA